MDMKTARTGMTVAMLLTASVALAMPTFYTEFSTVYKVPKDSTLKKANCGLCHQGMVTTKYNPYGLDLKKVMDELKIKKITAEVFKKVEELDSDKDGVKNIDEIKGNTLPGDPKSVDPKSIETKPAEAKESK